MANDYYRPLVAKYLSVLSQYSYCNLLTVYYLTQQQGSAVSCFVTLTYITPCLKGRQREENGLFVKCEILQHLCAEH